MKPPPNFDYWLPQWMERELWGPNKMSPGMRARMLRHSAYMNKGVPTAYAGAESTVAATPDIIKFGARLYHKHS